MGVARVVAVAQGKGGVGKTSLAANVAGLAAKAGHRVLAIDLDQQGNLSRDLGYLPQDGEALLQAVVAGRALPITRDVRPGLDVVTGGPAVGDLLGVAFARLGRGGSSLGDLLSSSLGEAAAGYDLVVVDTPPGERLLVEAVLQAASYVLVPTRPDEASLDGLERVAERCVAARDHNPGLTLLGVCLFGVGVRSGRLARSARESVEELLGGVAPVFEAQVRYAEAAAVDARRQGLLVHELEEAAVTARQGRLAALRARQRPQAELLTRDAAGLAADYAAVALETLTRMRDLEAGKVPA